MVGLHKPNLLALLETKAHSDKSIDRICTYASLTHFVCVEAQGFSGGIWLLWDACSITLEVVAATSQSITVFVRDRLMAFSVVSVIYAAPNYLLRSALLAYLKELGTLIDVPWLLVGDWNQVLLPGDKLGGRPVQSSISAPLWSVISECALVDVGFSGCKFT